MLSINDVILCKKCSDALVVVFSRVIIEVSFNRKRRQSQTQTTASEAKDWGFVDDITDYEEDIKPIMTESVDVKEYAPFILTYIATMFFGVQFESIDRRFSTFYGAKTTFLH